MNWGLKGDILLFVPHVFAWRKPGIRPCARIFLGSSYCQGSFVTRFLPPLLPFTIPTLTS
jgi:hypothetical protein